MEVDAQRISFSVDRIGSPVVVRVSWYPAWSAVGAEGPYRLAPNVMIVVPTAEHVELRFRDRTIDRVFQVMSGLGIVGIAFLRRPRRPRPRCLAAR